MQTRSSLSQPCLFNTGIWKYNESAFSPQHQQDSLVRKRAVLQTPRATKECQRERRDGLECISLALLRGWMNLKHDQVWMEQWSESQEQLLQITKCLNNLLHETTAQSPCTKGLINTIFGQNLMRGVGGVVVAWGRRVSLCKMKAAMYLDRKVFQ